MRIAHTLHSHAQEMDHRKKSIQRKGMGEAYKKTSQFVKASQNPMLVALENLIARQPEKELLETEIPTASKQRETSDGKMFSQPTQMDNQAHKAVARKDIGGATQVNAKQSLLSDADKDMLQLLEQVRQAAIAPVQPTLQDLQVAERATQNMQQISEAHAIEDVPQFPYEESVYDIAPQFLKNVTRDVTAPTIFGKDVDKLLEKRAFYKAKWHYKNHMQMVENGYGMLTAPRFSEIA